MPCGVVYTPLSLYVKTGVDEAEKKIAEIQGDKLHAQVQEIQSSYIVFPLETPLLQVFCNTTDRRLGKIPK